MLKHGIPAEDLCLDVVKTETLVRLYSGTVLPIDSNDLEEVTLIPPEVPKKIGRPRGKRIKNHLEKIHVGKTAARCVEPSDTISVHVLESNDFLVSLCVELKACF